MTIARSAFALAVVATVACAPITRDSAGTEGAPVRPATGAPPVAMPPPGVSSTFAIDSARSLIVVLVRRGGPLARFGHDHVVASHSVTGEVAPTEGRAELTIPVREMIVDEPDLRREANLDSVPSAADVEGTRTNMLAGIFTPDTEPVIRVSISGARDRTGELTLPAVVSINGRSRPMAIDASLARTDDEVRVSGRTTLLQSDFGIAPYSILGGALVVMDRVDVRFDLLARRTRSDVPR